MGEEGVAIVAAMVVAIAVLAGLFVYYEFVVKRVWVIQIRDAVPKLAKGKIAQRVVGELADVLRRNGVRRGTIYGRRRGSAITLGFSRSIPQSCRQALRNVWSMHAR